MAGRGDTATRRMALAGVIISTAVLSYSTLHNRADHIGFVWWSTWLYPIGLDALIVGASRTWQNSELSTGTRRLAKWITLGAIASGMAAFVAEFYPKGWDAVAFALLVPASLAASLILTSKAAADRKANDAPKQDKGTSDDASRPSEPVQLGVTGLSQVPWGEHPADIPDESFRDFADRTLDELRDAPADDAPAQVWTNMEPITVPVDPTRVTGVELFTTIDGSERIPVEMTTADTIEFTPGSVTIPATVTRNGGVSVAVDEPTEKTTKKPDGQKAPGGASVDEKKRWIHEQLDKGVTLKGADVDKQFPGGSRNGARLLRSVIAERAARG